MAGSISKYFYQAAANKTCADFHHPGRTCTQAAIECIKNGVLGSAKFYFPLCLVSWLETNSNLILILTRNVILASIALKIQQMEWDQNMEGIS